MDDPGRFPKIWREVVDQDERERFRSAYFGNEKSDTLWNRYHSIIADLSLDDRSVILAGLRARFSKDAEWSRAKQVVFEMPDSPRRMTAIESLASGWSQSDLDGAVEWASSLGAVEDQKKAYASIAPELARQRGIAVMSDWISQIDDSNLRKILITYTASAAARSGAFVEAADYISALEDPSERAEGYYHLYANGFADIESRTQSALGLPTVEERDAALSGISTLAYEDPMKASQWLATLPVDAQLKPLQTIAFQWSANHSLDAIAWAESLPNATLKDAAFETIALNVAIRNQSAGEAIAERISDERLREKTLRAVRGDIFLRSGGP